MNLDFELTYLFKQNLLIIKTHTVYYE